MSGRVEIASAPPSWSAPSPDADVSTPAEVPGVAGLLGVGAVVDRRAARVLAEAQAERVRLLAEAEAATALEQQRAARAAESARVAREHAQWQRDTRNADRERREATRRARAEARTAAARARSVRLSRVARAAGARVGLVPAVAVIVASAAVACWGQYVYARDVMGLGALGAVTVPVMIEGATWAVAWLAHQAVARARPAGVLRGATWALAGLAAGLNGWHGTASGGTAVGVSLALASLMGPAMWELLLAGTRDRVAGRTAGQVRAGVVRWLRWPVTSWHAATTAAARGCSPAEAWAAAWLDRHGVQVHADARARWLARRVRAQQRRDDAEAVRAGRWRLEAGRVVHVDHKGADQRPHRSEHRPARGRTTTTPLAPSTARAPLPVSSSSRAADTARRLVEARAGDPTATHAELAQRLGVSERTVRRHLSATRTTHPPVTPSPVNPSPATPQKEAIPHD